MTSLPWSNSSILRRATSTRAPRRRGRSRVDPATAAAAAVAGFVGLTVVMDWVPTPLNRNLARSRPAERLPGTVIHTAVGAAVVAADLRRHRWLGLAGAVWYSSVLAVAGLNWWVPYLTGVTVGEIDASTVEDYADNPRVLPAIAGRPVVPDVQHMLIHASVAAACVLNWLAFVRRPR